MSKRRRPPQADLRQRQLLAQNAARIMRDSGQRDYELAKRKAALQLGITDNSQLPCNEEIEIALQEQQRLFHAGKEPPHLKHMRQSALEAMSLLADFQPRLVGPLLSGSAEPHTPVYLHLFADTPEDVLIFLLDHQIPFAQGDRTVRYGNGRTVTRPKFGFFAGEQELQLTVFSPEEIRQAPLSPVDGRPMQRADRSQLEKIALSAD